ncbi:hypothetical protein [Fictibacillus sp. NRS-1165]|uniref:hypothetical protein n=1 Tax=Fictibacillus sp. NRS-1165 TaxID=3144463 RepID=UPI003D1AEB9F
MISVQLKDKKGMPFDELEVNHEKLMHFILISEDLKQYIIFILKRQVKARLK